MLSPAAAACSSPTLAAPLTTTKANSGLSELLRKRTVSPASGNPTSFMEWMGLSARTLFSAFLPTLCSKVNTEPSLPAAPSLAIAASDQASDCVLYQRSDASSSDTACATVPAWSRSPSTMRLFRIMARSRSREPKVNPGSA